MINDILDSRVDYLFFYRVLGCPLLFFLLARSIYILGYIYEWIILRVLKIVCGAFSSFNWHLSSALSILNSVTGLTQERSKEDDGLESLLDNVVGLRQMLESAGDPCPLSDQDVEPVLSAPDSLQNLFNNR